MISHVLFLWTSPPRSLARKLGPYLQCYAVYFSLLPLGWDGGRAERELKGWSMFLHSLRSVAPQIGKEVPCTLNISGPFGLPFWERRSVARLREWTGDPKCSGKWGFNDGPAWSGVGGQSHLGPAREPAVPGTQVFPPVPRGLSTVGWAVFPDVVSICSLPLYGWPLPDLRTYSCSQVLNSSVGWTHAKP